MGCNNGRNRRSPPLSCVIRTTVGPVRPVVPGDYTSDLWWHRNRLLLSILAGLVQARLLFSLWRGPVVAQAARTRIGRRGRVEGVREAARDRFWLLQSSGRVWWSPDRRAVGLGIAYRLLRHSKVVGPHGPPRDTYKKRRKSPIIDVSGGRSYAFWTSRARPRRPFRTRRP